MLNTTGIEEDSLLKIQRYENRHHPIFAIKPNLLPLVNHVIIIQSVPGTDLSSADNLILNFFAQFDKESCISSHSDQKVLILFRIFLSIDQGQSIYNVELGVVNV
jgi:hypothetical protein